MIEELVTIQDSFLLVLDSVNADIYNNGLKKSSCTFYLEEPIRKRLIFDTRIIHTFLIIIQFYMIMHLGT